MGSAPEDVTVGPTKVPLVAVVVCIIPLSVPSSGTEVQGAEGGTVTVAGIADDGDPAKAGAVGAPKTVAAGITLLLPALLLSSGSVADEVGAEKPCEVLTAILDIYKNVTG